MASTLHSASFAAGGTGGISIISSSIATTQKSTIERGVALVKNGLFGVLFVMAKDAHLARFWVVLELVIDFFQLLSFPFNAYGQDFPWNPAQSGWLQRLVKPFVFETYAEDSAAVFWVAVSILILFLANAAFVAYSFSRNKYRMMWTLTTLRTVSGLVSTVLFIPFTGILAARLKCHGHECWTGIDLFEKILAIVVGFAFLTLSLLSGICFCEPNPAARSALARPHSRVDLYASFIRAVLTVLFTLVGSSSISRWALTAILLAGASSTLALFVWYLPYYRHNYNLIKCATFGVLTWSAICLVVTQIVGDDSDAFLFFLIAAPLVVISAVCAGNYRRRFIERTPCNRLSGALEIELKARFHLIANGLFFTYRPNASTIDALVDPDAKVVDPDFAKKIISEVNGWYRLATRKYPRSSLLRFFWSNHHQYFNGNNQLALGELQAADEMSPRLDEEFFIYRRRKMVQDEQNGMRGDVLMFVKFQRHITEAQQYDIRATKAQLAMWTELLKRDPAPLSLNTIARRVTESIARAQKSFQELIKINANAPQTLRMYAGFLMDVVHDPNTAELLLARASELDDATALLDADRGAGYASQGLELETMGAAEMLMDDRFATIAISGDLRKEGVILEMNSAACKMLGYRPRELLGRNITAIIPEPFASNHTKYLRRYLEEGRSTWIDRAVTVYALHKSGFAVPINMLIRQMCSPTGGIVFIATIKTIMVANTGSGTSLETEDYGILAHRDGTVITCTATCAGLLGITADQLSPQAQKMQVVTYIPEFASMLASAVGDSKDFAIADFIEKGRFPSVAVETTRGRVMLPVFLSLLTSTSGESAVVIRFELHRLAVAATSSATETASAAGSIASRRRAPSIDPGSPCMPALLERIDGLRASSSTSSGEDTEAVCPVAEDDASGYRRASRRMQKNPSKVQFESSEMPSLVAGDSPLAEPRDPFVDDVRVDAVLVADKDETEPAGMDDTVIAIEKKKKGHGPQSITSSSHASSTASRVDAIREKILFGAGAGSGRLGHALQIALLLAAVGLVAIAASGFVLVDQQTATYAAAVDTVIGAAQRRLTSYDIADTTRLLVLRNLGAYFLYNETTLRDRLLLAADDLETAHSRLYAGVRSMNSALRALYIIPSIPIQTFEGGEKQTTVDNLWNSFDVMIAEARSMSRMGIEEFVDRNPSVYYVTKNALNSVRDGMERSMDLYQKSATDANVDADTASSRTYYIAIAFILFAIFAVLVPLLAVIEVRQTNIIWHFLVIPKPVRRAMAEHCRARLEAREALEEGFDDEVLRAEEEAEHAERPSDANGDAASEGTGDGGRGVTSGRDGRLLRRAERRSHHRHDGKQRTVPNTAERFKLFFANQWGNMFRIAVLLVIALAFFSVIHSITSTFITNNSSTAVAVNCASRSSYLALTTLFFIRGIAAENTTEGMLWFEEQFHNASEQSLQLHDAILYGDASKGIKATAEDPRFQQLLFQDGCVAGTPADCPSFYNGILGSGLNGAFRRFMRDMKNVQAPATNLSKPTSLADLAGFINDGNLNNIERFGQKYLRPAMVRMTEMYGTTLVADVNAFHNQLLQLTIVMCCLIVVVYLGLLFVIPRRLNVDGRRMQILLLCVSSDVLRSIPAFARILKNDYV